MKSILARLKLQLNKLLAQKLVIAFIVGFVASFADAITGIAQNQQPLSTSLLISSAVGALAAAVRGLLVLSPINLVPSDAVGSKLIPAKVDYLDPKVVQLPETLKATSRLGRHIEHDPRSRNYAFALTGHPLTKVLWPRAGSPLNQGNLGSCTGNAITGVLNTAPFRKNGAKLYTEKEAVRIYELATTLDKISGSYPPDDTGSSGLAVCKAAKQLGLISGYKHAFSLQAALEALMSGPVITGVAWYEGFDTPDPNGLVQISGQVRGGHEFEILGYDPATDLVEAENSWGASWGVKGRFFFTSATWGKLLAQQGDVTVPVP